MLKIKIHPAFWIFAFIMVLQDNYITLLATLLCVAIHEWAHSKVAYNEGYYLDTLNLMPFGAMLSGNDNFSQKEGVKIAFAGPLVNFLTCIMLLALWWVMPPAYNYTKVIFDASVSLGFFNLLPIFPLDGARILIAISNNKHKSIKILKNLGIVVSSFLGILFLASFFYKANLSLGIIAATIYISSIGGSENESYKHIYESCFLHKKIDVPIEKQTIIVHQNLKLVRLIKQLKPNKDICFEVVDDSYKTICILTEKDLLKLSSKHNLQMTLKALLSP